MNNKKTGRIYILRNSAIKDSIIKIGRTKRLSEKRAKEISSGTGVPLEYEVLYEDDVLDCVLAEKLIHKYLDQKRVNPKREFFNIPLKDAVKVVNKICLKVNNSITKKAGGKLAIFLDVTNLTHANFHKIKAILQNHKGKSPVYLTLDTSNYKRVNVLVGEDLYVKFSPTLINDLKGIKGIKEIEFHSTKISRLGELSEKVQIVDYDC